MEEEINPICDACGKEIPVEELGDVHVWYEAILSTIVLVSRDCFEKGIVPKGLGN